MKDTVVQVNHAPEVAKFEYQDLGPAMNHNYLCAVCREKKAVLDMSVGILQPCWSCQDKYKIVKMNWFAKTFSRFFEL